MKLNPATNCGCCGSPAHAGCGCADPTIPATLYGVHDPLGSFTLTYDSGLGYWAATSSYSYPECNVYPCGAEVVTLHWEFHSTLYGGYYCGARLWWMGTRVGVWVCPDDSGSIMNECQFPLGDSGGCNVAVICNPFALTMDQCTYPIGTQTDVLLCIGPLTYKPTGLIISATPPPAAPGRRLELAADYSSRLPPLGGCCG